MLHKLLVDKIINNYIKMRLLVLSYKAGQFNLNTIPFPFQDSDISMEGMKV